MDSKKHNKIKIVFFKSSNFANVLAPITNNGKKIVNLIDYPIDNLDLTKYCIGYDKKKSIFSLVGVCNHIGTLNSGHYYSYCKQNDEWYNFDDTSVSKINKNDIITNNAYCLFYKKNN